MKRILEIKTPLIIKETLGEEIYDQFEELRKSSAVTYNPMILSPKMFDEFTRMLERDIKLPYKLIKHEKKSSCLKFRKKYGL